MSAEGGVSNGTALLRFLSDEGGLTSHPRSRHNINLSTIMRLSYISISHDITLPRNQLLYQTRRTKGYMTPVGSL